MGNSIEALRPHAGGDVTPAEAYKMVSEDPEQTFMIDCRSRAEYKFIGHAAMAYNIPCFFWTPEGFVENANFVDDVEARFKKTDRLVIICRRGNRSCSACDKLAKAGFKHVFNVLYGFEGDQLADEKSVYYGYRLHINCWHHDGLPYTYHINEDLAYKPIS